jgi:hypothetical protein
MVLLDRLATVGAGYAPLFPFRRTERETRRDSRRHHGPGKPTIQVLQPHEFATGERCENNPFAPQRLPGAGLWP